MDEFGQCRYCRSFDAPMLDFWLGAGMTKVFIVEDSPVVCERLEALLQDIERVEVVGKADNAIDAVTGIHRLRPEAVVLDVNLKQGNGIGVLREIRKRGCATTTIMLTNHADAGMRQRCLDFGADHFFCKTGEFERIRDVLANLGRERQTRSN